jgi:hypothetical protein
MGENMKKAKRKRRKIGVKREKKFKGEGEHFFGEGADLKTPVHFCVNLSIRPAGVSDLFAHDVSGNDPRTEWPACLSSRERMVRVERESR